MRFCHSCSNWKPDANFSVSVQHQADVKQEDGFYERCLQCRTTPNLLRGAKKVPGPEKLPEAFWVGEERLRAREEFAAFQARGAPVIERPYVRWPDGRVIQKQIDTSRRKKQPFNFRGLDYS